MLSQNYDKIYLKNKQVYEGNVIQITTEFVEMNPKDEKPFIKIHRDSISILIYKDNTVETLESSNVTNNKNISKPFEFEQKFTYKIKDLRSFKLTNYILDQKVTIYDSIAGNLFFMYIDGTMVARKSVDKYIVYINEIDVDVGLINNKRDYSHNIIKHGGLYVLRRFKHKAIVCEPVGFDLGDYYINATITFENIEEYYNSSFSQNLNRGKGDLIITVRILSNN
jgi:hypothetical protein